MGGCGYRELAADLIGEVFAVALSRCPRYDPSHPSALPWLIGITAGRIIGDARVGRAAET